MGSEAVKGSEQLIAKRVARTPNRTQLPHGVRQDQRMDVSLKTSIRSASATQGQRDVPAWTRGAASTQIVFVLQIVYD